MALAAVCGAISAATAPSAVGQSPQTRRYVEGEADRYELRVRVTGAASELFGVSEHHVVSENGKPLERIRWVRAVETTSGDLSDQAQASGTFELTLDSESLPMAAPAVGSPAIQMLVDSLQQVYAALNPTLGLAQLTAPGDVVASEAPYVEDGFAGRGQSLKRRASSLTFRFVSADAKEAVIRTEFSAPLTEPWEPLRSWMETDCSGRPGNFAELVDAGQGFIAAWGCESASVTARISMETGKILRAELQSISLYHRRWCTDETLSECGKIEQGEMGMSATLVLKQPDSPLPADRLTVNPTDGLEYAQAPAGTFRMGCVPDDTECYPREVPRHEVRISKPFWIARTEVPVHAYERFVAAAGLAMPPEPQGLEDFNDGWSKKSHPIVKVTWDEARSYCEWAGGRLPTEAEWEYAARGGLDGLKYPWGNERSHDEANYWRSGGRDVWKNTAPVGSFSSNGFGLYDMAGNVYEWIADWYDEEYYQHSLGVDPAGPSRGRQRVVRGGAGFINPAVLRISTRLENAPDARRLGVGFRCALDFAP